MYTVYVVDAVSLLADLLRMFHASSVSRRLIPHSIVWRGGGEVDGEELGLVAKIMFSRRKFFLFVSFVSIRLFSYFSRSESLFRVEQYVFTKLA